MSENEKKKIDFLTFSKKKLSEGSQENPVTAAPISKLRQIFHTLTCRYDTKLDTINLETYSLHWTSSAEGMQQIYIQACLHIFGTL